MFRGPECWLCESRLCQKRHVSAERILNRILSNVKDKRTFLEEHGVGKLLDGEHLALLLKDV